MGDDRVVHVPVLARVEGEGSLHLTVRDGEVTDARLQIYEPPRYFEGVLVGRRWDEPIDITSRICGICPIAYQMSAAHAIEDAFGVSIEPGVRALRRLIYCGEWIESHLLHVILLHAPDFLGYASGVEMAADHRDAVAAALRVKKLGNDLMAAVGGRAIHPINVRVGGFYRVPTRRELEVHRAELDHAAATLASLAWWVAGFDFPDLDEPAELVSLVHDREYPFNEGEIATSTGRRFPVADYEAAFTEQLVGHSTALHSTTADGRPYLVGPLARWNLAYRQLSEPVRELADAIGQPAVCTNPFRSIVVRVLESLESVIEAARIIDGYEPPDRPAVEVVPRAGIGRAATEAPRGTLYHRYELDDDGLIRAALIVPPTAQVQPVIEDELRRFAQANLDLDDAALQWRCEQVVRNFDPCISCSTHFLRLTVDRG